MYIHGSFINKLGQTVTVEMVTKGDRSRELEIGTEEAGLWFAAEDAVVIEAETNDTFDVMLRRSCSVRLLSRGFVPDFFCANCREAVVNVRLDGRCVFAGFIEPMSLSQPFNDLLDEVELSCVDALSALQYSKWRDAGAAGVDWAHLRSTAGQRTMRSALETLLGGVASGLDIAGGSAQFLYDGSRSLVEGGSSSGSFFQPEDFFAKVSVSDLLFLGDSEDDAWTQAEVVEEILRYFDLHILQDGLTFYVFAWSTAKGAGAIKWVTLFGGAEAGEHAARAEAALITAANAADCGTSISVGEVFNRLELTCDVREVDEVVASPLDSDSLEYAHDRMVQWCTEMFSSGTGSSAWAGFMNLVFYADSSYGGARKNEWFARVRRNADWAFPMAGDEGTDLVSHFMDSGGSHLDDSGSAEAVALLDWLGQNAGAAVVAMGKRTVRNSYQDNSPVASVELSDCLVISVNGNGDDTEAGARPSESDLLAAAPVAVYRGGSNGAAYSPPDGSTTNYIVISGKLALNPVPEVSVAWCDRKLGDWVRSSFMGRSVNANGSTVLDNGDLLVRPVGLYNAEDFYTFLFLDHNGSARETAAGLYPYSGEGRRLYQYNYSKVGDSEDTVSKVGVLACMLTIGCKCLVEKTTADDLGTGVPYTGRGVPDDFVWREFKPREQCSGDDEYYAQSFTVGIDPKIGDLLLGAEYPIQGNYDYKLGLPNGVTGTAIPIRHSDALAGDVTFRILGPVNALWDNITRRHPTFFRHTEWTTTSVPLLAHVRNIVVKDFSVKVYSDNGLTGSDGTDKDIVYMSDTDDTFINRKDDIEFRLTTALTSEECKALGVANSVKMSAPVRVADNLPLREIYDSSAAGRPAVRPEQMYVDNHWRECHAPRLTLEQNVTDVAADTADPFARWRHPALAGRDFFVTGAGRNLSDGTVKLNLKEIETDD